MILVRSPCQIFIKGCLRGYPPAVSAILQYSIAAGSAALWRGIPPVRPGRAAECQDLKARSADLFHDLCLFHGRPAFENIAVAKCRLPEGAAASPVGP